MATLMLRGTQICFGNVFLAMSFNEKNKQETTRQFAIKEAKYPANICFDKTIMFWLLALHTPYLLVNPGQEKRTYIIYATRI